MNAIEHGASPIEVFMTLENSKLSFGIWDQGSGIHKTLPNNPKLSDTRDKTSAAIIRLSLEEYITGTGQVGRGIGLSLLTKYVERSPAKILIWSNGAWIMQKKNHFFEQPSPQQIAGTMILLSVPHG